VDAEPDNALPALDLETFLRRSIDMARAQAPRAYSITSSAAVISPLPGFLAQ
jgi:hypothetical protein